MLMRPDESANIYPGDHFIKQLVRPVNRTVTLSPATSSPAESTLCVMYNVNVFLSLSLCVCEILFSCIYNQSLLPLDQSYMRDPPRATKIEGRYAII